MAIATGNADLKPPPTLADHLADYGKLTASNDVFEIANELSGLIQDVEQVASVVHHASGEADDTRGFHPTELAQADPAQAWRFHNFAEEIGWYIERLTDARTQIEKAAMGMYHNHVEAETEAGFDRRATVTVTA